MTEAEWLACEDTGPMLRHLTHEVHRAADAVGDHPRDRPLVSDRKLRLFAVACCRRAWPLPTDEESRHAVEMAERFADGAESKTSLMEARVHAAEAAHDPAAWAAHACARESADETYMRCHWLDGDLPEQADLLREIINPFRPVTLPSEAAFCPECGGKGERLELVAGSHFQGGMYGMVRCDRCLGSGLAPGDCPWLTWNDGAVPRLAERIYQARAWDEMPILADALEEAGCDSADILTHLRQPYRTRYRLAGATGCAAGLTLAEAENAAEELREHFHGMATVWIEAPVHCRGCWAIDLLTGRG